MKIRFVRFLAACAVVVPASSFASDPSSHDITVPTTGGQSVEYTWTGTVLPGSSGAATNSCISDDPTADIHTINLTVPAGTYDNVDVAAHFHIEWTATADPLTGINLPDLVLTIEKDFVDRGSSDGGDPQEDVFLANLEEGAFLVVACPFAANAPVSYSGKLTLTASTREANADTDGDGVANTNDFCPGTPSGTTVDIAGCPPAVCDVAAAPASAPASTSGITEVDLAVSQDLNSLPRDDRYGAFVHFAGLGTRDDQNAVLDLLGVKRTHDFRRYTTAVFAEGPVWAFRRLSSHPMIARLEYNAPLRYMDATQHWAMRTRMVQEKVSRGPFLAANGDHLTGKGIRLGIIDSGMFGAHPDFINHISHNFKYAVAGYVDVGPGDSENAGGGHGTHVSGIVAGDGTMSDGNYPIPEVAPYFRGTFTAASPEAELLHWGHGAAIVVVNAAAAYAHILDNLAAPGFANLKAVNNSYGETTPGTPYNPNDANKQLIRKIAACGINMVFAAGNDGGNGSTDQTSSYCKDPTPGVICVGSYNDEGTGRLDGAMSGFSSRSLVDRPAAYVDIAAPGDLSTSACAQATPSQAICTGGDDEAAETEWQPWYGTISGTSMATPNITSVIGILSQADPTLTSAEREEILQRTARKIGDPSEYVDDPQLPGSTIHFARGAGLVDVEAALDYLINVRGVGLTRSALPAEGDEWVVLDGDDADIDVAEGAADAVKLTMQNVNREGLAGVMFRLTLADATDFNSPALSYRVEYNPRGKALFTTINADASLVAPAEPGETNNAIATFVERVGNVVSFFVPYSQMGFPPINEPIHNVRVVVSNAAGAVDYAPSPAGYTVAQAAVSPMFGRAFTTRLAPGLPPLSTERVCELPGLTMVTSPGGYAFATGSNTGHDDLRRIWVAEPGDMPGKLVFTMKVENLTPTPIANYRWYVYFNTPTPVDGGNQRFAAMDTVPPGGSSAIPGFSYGYTSSINGPVAVGTFTIEGDLDEASTWDPDGTITLVVDKATFGLNTGDIITGIAGSIRNTSNAEQGSGLTADSASAIGPYTLVGNLPCPVVPIPSLVADKPSGRAPLTVTFDGSASVGAASGATIKSYEFSFGDGSAPVTQNTPVIQHTYNASGTFIAKLSVVDSDDVASETPAEQMITVTGAGGGSSTTAITNNRLGGALSLGMLLLLGLASGARRR